jgi:hypothetical protein
LKKIARFILVFSISFALLFLAAVLLGLLTTWINFAKIIPTETGVLQSGNAGLNIINLAWQALLAALYLSILFALSYTSRKKIPTPLAIISIICLSSALTAAFSIGITRIKDLQPLASFTYPIHAEPGLILTQPGNVYSHKTDIILLKESSDILGPRLVSIPGEPLTYQETPLGPNNTITRLPALSFGDELPWFLKSIGIDFSLSADELRMRQEKDFIQFAAYAFSLILFLASLRFIMDLSQWPLANLFLGALTFRGILALEIFLNSWEIKNLIASVLGGRLPLALITPAVFCAFGILILLYTLLTGIARSVRRADG